MANKVTTLFIEDTAIRLLVARGRHAEKWASVPLEPGLVKHGQVQDKVRLAEKLKETFRWANVGNRVILGLSEPGSLYRIISLPKLPDAILPEAIKREAERVIPLPQDEIYLSYQVISTQQDNMQIFLAAYSKIVVDTLISTLQSAGIRPISLDLVPLALCRAINKSTAIVVSLRASNFEIAVMAENIPQVIRSLSLPGEETSLLEKLPTITEELERTVTFYNSSHPDKPIDKNVPVFVDGELVQVPNTWSSLVGTLGNMVTPLPSLVTAEKEFDPSQYTVNIGLALKVSPRDVSGSVINFNALPHAFLPEKAKASRIIWPVAAAVGILILVFIWFQTSATKEEVTRLNAELASTQTHITQETSNLAAIQTQVSQVEAQVNPLESQITAAQSLVASFSKTIDNLSIQRNNTDSTMNQITSLLPANATIISIGQQDGTAIQGEAPDTNTIFTYARALTASPSFTSVNINSISRVDTVAADGTTTTTYSFQITAN